jgi:AraC-like DNA-binding protein
MAMGAGVAERDRTARLAAFNRVSTDDVDAAAEAVGRIFCPHELTPVRASAPDFYALHNCAAFDGFSINYVAYGGSVSIDPGCLDSFFLLQIPLQGSARIATAAREVESRPGAVASLLSPTIPTQMTWDGDCGQLILLLDRRLVEQRAAALSGKPVGAVEFAPAIDLNQACGRELLSRTAYLVDLAEHLGPRRPLAPVAAAEWREILLGALLNGQRHSRSQAMQVFEGRAETQPQRLRRARDCLYAHASEPLDLAQLAEVTRIGIRALQIGFRRHFGTSISQMLLDIRLAHLNARLSCARPGEHVTDIAYELGFTHLSRMANAYGKKFGETPSTTLRRAS